MGSLLHVIYFYFDWLGLQTTRDRWLQLFQMTIASVGRKFPNVNVMVVLGAYAISWRIPAQFSLVAKDWLGRLTAKEQLMGFVTHAFMPPAPGSWSRSRPGWCLAAVAQNPTGLGDNIIWDSPTCSLPGTFSKQEMFDSGVTLLHGAQKIGKILSRTTSSLETVLGCLAGSQEPMGSLAWVAVSCNWVFGSRQFHISRVCSMCHGVINWIKNNAIAGVWPVWFPVRIKVDSLQKHLQTSEMRFNFGHQGWNSLSHMQIPKLNMDFNAIKLNIEHRLCNEI